jgi:hypothetical protein
VGLYIWLSLSGIESLFRGRRASSLGTTYIFLMFYSSIFFLKLTLRRHPLLCVVHLDIRSKRDEAESRRSWFAVENGRLVKGDLIITSKGKVGWEKCKRCI